MQRFLVSLQTVNVLVPIHVRHFHYSYQYKINISTKIFACIMQSMKPKQEPFPSPSDKHLFLLISFLSQPCASSTNLQRYIKATSTCACLCQFILFLININKSHIRNIYGYFNYIMLSHLMALENQICDLTDAQKTLVPIDHIYVSMSSYIFILYMYFKLDVFLLNYFYIIITKVTT